MNVNSNTLGYTDKLLKIHLYLIAILVSVTLILYLPFVYIVICWVGSILFFVANSRQNYPFLYIFGVSLCFVFSLISYSIEDVSDFSNYRAIIQQVIELGVDFSVRGGEVGFYLLVSFLEKIVGPDERVIHFSILVIINIVLFTSLYRLNPKSALLVFITSQFFYLLMVAPFLTRQMLSFSIVLLSISLSRYKKLLYISAIFVHFSALIYIFILCIPKRIINSKAFVFYILIFAVLSSIVLRVEVFKTIVESGLTPGFIEPKVRFYLRLFDESKPDYLGLLMAAWPIIIKLIYRNESLGDRFEDVINIYFISALLFVSVVNIPILPTRIAFPLYYSFPICYIFFSKRLRRWKDVFVISMMLFSILLSVYRIYLNDFSKPWLMLADGNIIMSDLFDYLKHFI